MELQVIRHKTARQFFEGFYPDKQVDSYAYQLERMFEQGSAVEGDLFVVTENEQPLVSVEIYRNNTRRILEKTPLVAVDKDLTPKEFTEAMKLIFEHLNDDIIAGSIDKELQISVSKDYKYFAEYEKLLKKYKFINIVDMVKYEIDMNDFKHSIKSDCFYTKLSERPVEERFDLISRSTFNEILDRYSNEKVYIDLIEEGYQSEELWESIEFNGKDIGFMMPIFTNGLKNKLELLNYGCLIGNYQDQFYIAVIERMTQLAKAHNIEDIVLNVNHSEINFIDKLDKIGCDKQNVIRNYIRI